MTAAAAIRDSLDRLAEEIAREHERRHPEVFARYPAVGRQRCLEDARFHLQYLAAALDAGSRDMFADYISWAKVMLAARNVPPSDLADNLAIVESVVDGEAAEYVRSAIDALPSMPDGIPSFLDEQAPLANVASGYLRALLRGSRREAASLILETVEDGTPARDIYVQVFEPVQQELGRLWQLNRITVAQEHFCTAATQQVMTQLYGQLFAGEKLPRRAVGMCVGGELHEIGLRIVTDLLEIAGWQTWYLGANTPPASAVQMCVDNKANVLLVSATLPPHLATVREVIRLFRANEKLAKAKARVIVGGRAFRMEPELWRAIGADGYAKNADECLVLLDRLVT